MSWTCSDEVQPSTAWFIASQQLQIYPIEYHCTVFPRVKIVILFNKKQERYWQADQARFPLASDAESSEINKTAASNKNTARATKTWMGAWAE